MDTARDLLDLKPAPIGSLHSLLQVLLREQRVHHRAASSVALLCVVSGEKLNSCGSVSVSPLMEHWLCLAFVALLAPAPTCRLWLVFVRFVRKSSQKLLAPSILNIVACCVYDACARGIMSLETRLSSFLSLYYVQAVGRKEFFGFWSATWWCLACYLIPYPPLLSLLQPPLFPAVRGPRVRAHACRVCCACVNPFHHPAGFNSPSTLSFTLRASLRYAGRSRVCALALRVPFCLPKN